MQHEHDTAEAMEQQEETSTHFVNGEHDEDIKLIVLNYGKWKDAKSLDQWLRGHNVIFRKVQKSRQLSFGFIHFHTQEERDAALPVLQQLEWNGEKLDVKTALPRKGVKPARDHKRSRGGDDSRNGGDRSKKAKTATASTASGGDGVDDEDGVDGAAETTAKPQHAREVVTPWADVAYEDQLERKEAEMKKVLVKIVRQTRKEYFKKEKRVNVEQQRHRKKQDGGDEDEVTAHTGSTTYIPTWLTSHGSLFAVADGVLYSREHEAPATTPWSAVVKSPNVTAIVSFGGELVSATSTHEILALKQGPDAMYWDKLCAAPSEAVVSMASLRAALLCCTSSGRILKQEGMGRFATGTWVEVAQVNGARSIVIHNGYVYALCGAEGTSVWFRAPVVGDALDDLTFSEHPWAALNGPATEGVYAGLCSHDHQLILLSGQSLIYSNPDSEDPAEAPVPLMINQDIQAVTGFASHKGLCCPMDSIHASPSTVGYRNKCEFSIGFDAEEKPCVGFRMGLFRDGSVIVSPPTDCVNVSPEMVKVCEVMQGLLVSHDVPVYDVKTQTGVWRQLTVRYSDRTQQLMIVLQINPKELWEDDKQRIYNVVRATFTDNAALGNVSVTSLFIQEYAGVSAASEDEPLIHLHGEKTIEELLLGKRFKISPNAFFQVNTPGAETLYSLVKQHANADPETLLYDVCCGTGTIGICASAGAGKVVGIEICKAATDDAVVNAELNEVSNVTFVNSKAEDVMKDLLKTKLDGADQHLKRVVAIVDPPRAGLHHQVLRSLRSCPPVDRIVYVSCNPTGSLIQDAITLCGPKTKSITGNAFRPVHAIPVDMFPHTPHCEMIIVFDRVRTHA